MVGTRGKEIYGEQTQTKEARIRIFSDHRTTRRQRLHYVMLEDDSLSFTAQDIDACIRHCLELGYTTIYLIGRTEVFKLEVQKIDEIMKTLYRHQAKK